MRGRLVIVGSDLVCKLDGTLDARVALTEQTVGQMRAWGATYRHAVEFDEQGALWMVGRELFGWLDWDGWAARWLRGTGARVMEVSVDTDAAEASRLLLDLPWELLADAQGFLAADSTQPLVVVRSLARAHADKPARPVHRDLAVMFMAASPLGQHVLDFEGEETAILAATKRLAVGVVVEESGCAALLKDRLAQEGPFDVVHVSCHGTIRGGVPVLAMETLEGELELVAPGDFAGVLGEDKPPLVFVSACRTAESAAGFAEPFVRALVRSGVRNVLGWDGSVYDGDASRFARTLYGELAEHASVPFAAAAARRDLLLAHLEDASVGGHWHLARVYAGPGGGGACCGKGLPGRRMRRDVGYKEFLDQANRRVPVATAREFVGRRRQVQAVLRAFRDGNEAGVLVWGMGNLGKSSLAARVANRTPRHRTVVVYGRYDALAIFEQLLDALPPDERAGCERAWLDQIAHDGAMLGRALEELLEGAFHDRPILLIIDDLEQILAAPSPGQARTPVSDAPGTIDAWRTALGSVLRAFAAASTDSRLLLTSRYDFTVPDGRGRDLADALERVPLRPMDREERAKQWAAGRTAGQTEFNADASELQLAVRAQAEAGGNPGLQEILCRPLLTGELTAASQAIDALARWKATGEVPHDENAAQEFFQRVSFETYRDALTEAELNQLRAATLFSEGLPVPVAALEAAGRTLGVPDPSACVRRLIALGLMDDWTDHATSRAAHAAANTLARPLAGDPLSDAEANRLASAVIGAITGAWQDGDGDFPYDARGVEAARLALAGDVPADVLDRTAYAAATFLFRIQHDGRGALALSRAAIAKIEAQGHAPRPQLLRLASDCAERIGENQLSITLLEQGLSLTAGDPIELALIAVQHASATVARDGPDQSLATLHRAAAALAQAGKVRDWAVTMGKIADILQARGELDEALRIRREEELPVYERLGDVRSRGDHDGQDRRHPAGARASSTKRCASAARRSCRSTSASATCARARSPWARSPTSCRRGARSTKRCASAARRSCRSTSASATSARARSPWARSPTSCRPAARPTRRCASAARRSCRSTSASATSARARSPWARSPTSCRPAARPTRRCASAARSSCRSTSASATSARGAVTMGKIADILQARGELDEALRIRREEELPVYRAPRRRPRARGHHGQDRRHPAGPRRDSTRRCASAARRSCRSTSASATSARARSPWARSPTSCRPAASSTRRCASAARRAAGLRAPRRRPLARGHHGQDRRHPAGPGRARRGAAHPPRGAAAGLRAPRRRPLAARSPWARSPTSCRRGRARRGAAHPPRGGAAGLRAPRRRPLARDHHGQDRRHPAGAGRARRGAAHPPRGGAARL